ncbi:MAG TPA: 30S ribosomal protein S20 [Candidatus Enterousia intestinigallinarum]|uniref:Small ribosomal subunit protein bS20 n=1 Tax=Candidatus Enterousia intestinigallinarum TaxID=2840790 RepID=A0A9D1FGJ6_9PROT|nr:30S ribosomal protein S20 [Candidatus Enterousia intestinigallinarum]
MANHKSSKKRILVTEKKNAVNNSRRSAVKTAAKKVLIAVESGDKAAATVAVRNAESRIMKSAGKVMPKKRAARKISRLTKRVAKMA